jgi:hypothetical protein
MLPKDVFASIATEPEVVLQNHIENVVNSTKTPDLIPIFYHFFRSLYAPVSNHVIPALILAELPL